MRSVRLRSRFVAFGATIAIVTGVVVGPVSQVVPAAAVGWDFVYGDPGPANYSQYQDVALAPDGSTYLAGFYSGTFHGLSSPSAYRYFLQRINADGVTAWTVEINTAVLSALTIPAVPDLIVDGLGNPILQISRKWFSFDASGLPVGSLDVPGGWGSQNVRLGAVKDGGFVAIVDGAAPKLQYRGADLVLRWEFDLSGLIEAPAVCAFGCGLIPDLAVVSDGTFWVVGRKNGVLITQSDALSMIHVSATGSQIAAIKYFGIVPAIVGPIGNILASSDSFIWVAVDAGGGAKVMSFAASDGHALGDVPRPTPSDLIATPTGTVNCGGLDFMLVSSSPLGSSIYRQQVFMNGTRLVMIAPCRQVASATGARTIMLLSYSMSGPLGGTYTLTASKALSSAASFAAMDADAGGNVVVVGSTTDGTVYAGSVGPASLQAASTRTQIAAAAVNERAVATRNPAGNLHIGFRAPGSVMELLVAGVGGVPADASAVVLNVTVTEAIGPGFVTVYPCGSARPDASNLNYRTASTVPNAVIAKVGVGGKVCLFTNNGTHLLTDVNGYFRDVSSYTPINPARILETRSGLATVDGQSNDIGFRPPGSDTELVVAGRAGVLTDASAVVLNVTVTEAIGSGFVTVYPCGAARPDASSLNYVFGSTVPNAVIAKVGVGGKVCLFTSNGTHLVADVNGYFPAAASYQPLTPARLLDTRFGYSTVDGQANGIGLRLPGVETQLVVAGRANVPADASAVVLNVTATEAIGSGFVTVYPCGSARPDASNLNYVIGSTVPNAVIAKIGFGGAVCLFTSNGTHLLADVGGFFPAASTYSPMTPVRILETRATP